MSEKRFSFSNYDCIGFDLDNTLAQYKVIELIEMEYKVLVKFLIEKGYSSIHLECDIDYDFIQKGLILDTSKGNILKIANDGKILRATHGTKLLTEDDIEKIYPNSHWALTDLLVQDPVAVWNGPNSEEMRSLLDCFDIIVSILFARCVDSVDEAKNGIQEKYSVYDDIYAGLVEMFRTDHFQTNQGGYYNKLKENPIKYYHKCSKKLLDWLTKLKSEGKLLFLITGSYVDYASLTASNTIGPNWKEYFDIIITYAKKPGFFSMDRKFIGLDGINQTGEIKPEDLELGGTYVNGNWQDLQTFLAKHSPKNKPNFLYIGDNIVQDVYAPNKYSHCDTVAVCAELDDTHPEEKVFNSKLWGPYFKVDGVDTIWKKLIENNAKLCIPDLDYAV